MATSGLQVFDVTTYGVVANNSMTSVATNNTAYIQDAISDAEAAGGGIVFFPPQGTSPGSSVGPWYIYGGVTVSSESIIIQGGGQGNTLLKQLESGATSVTVSANGFVLQDIEIDHSTNDNGIALYLDGGTGYHIERVNFNGGATAILTYNINGLYAHGLRISTGAGVYQAISLTGNTSAGSQEIHFSDCTVGGPGSGTNAGVSLANCSGTYWTGCDIRNFQNNLQFVPDNGGCFNHFFANCTFDVAGLAHAYVAPGLSQLTYNVHGLRFVGCWFGASGSYAVYLFGSNATASIQSVDILDCMIVGGSGYGIYVGNYTSYVRIHGGVIGANSTAGIIVAGTASFLNIRNVQFAYNYVDGYPSLTQPLAIDFEAACTNTYVSDCDCTRSGSTATIKFGVNPAVSTSIVNCPGYNDQAYHWTPSFSNGVNYNAPNVGDYYGPYLFCVSGGTGVSVAIGKSGGTAVSTGLADGAYTIAPGDVVAVSWTGGSGGKPTVNSFGM